MTDRRIGHWWVVNKKGELEVLFWDGRIWSNKDGDRKNKKEIKDIITFLKYPG